MQEYIRGKNILVTGGAGFLGRHVCAQLEKLEPASIYVPHFRHAVPGEPSYDLTEQEDVRALLDKTYPDVVIHLAAEVGGIGANRVSPGRFFYANAAMGLNLIEESRLRGVKKFVQVGTVCAYPKHTPVPFKEYNLWQGYPEDTNAPYGIAKKALLVMLQAYRQQYGFNGIYLLPVNLYGPGDNFDLKTSHVIPALIRKCEEARKQGLDEVVCWGTGGASREFLYVEDCARGIVMALQGYDGYDPVNLGSGQEIMIWELAKLIAKITGFKGRLIHDHDQPDGQPRRCLDTGRASTQFGFNASTKLEEGLQKTVEWYRQNTPI